jgi:hypothetical protein
MCPQVCPVLHAGLYLPAAAIQQQTQILGGGGGDTNTQLDSSSSSTGRFYMVMELLGSNLADMRRTGAWGVTEAAGMSAGTCKLPPGALRRLANQLLCALQVCDLPKIVNHLCCARNGDDSQQYPLCRTACPFVFRTARSLQLSYRSLHVGHSCCWIHSQAWHMAELASLWLMHDVWFIQQCMPWGLFSSSISNMLWWCPTTIRVIAPFNDAGDDVMQEKRAPIIERAR